MPPLARTRCFCDIFMWPGYHGRFCDTIAGMYVFSYGSNHPGQLEERLGHPVRTQGAFARGYERVFCGASQRWRGGVASLRMVSQSNGTVFGLVAEVSKADLDRLDGFEGIHTGNYTRETISVSLAEGGQVTAFVYISMSNQFTPPSRAYLEAVAKTVGAYWRNDDGSKVTWKDITVRPCSKARPASDNVRGNPRRKHRPKTQKRSPQKSVRAGDVVRVDRPRKPFLIKVDRVNVKTIAGRDERGKKWRVPLSYPFTVMKGGKMKVANAPATKRAVRSARPDKNQAAEFARRVKEIAQGIPDSFKPKGHFMDGAKIVSGRGGITAVPPKKPGGEGYNGWAYAQLPGMKHKVYLPTGLLSARFMAELRRRIVAEFPQATVGLG